MTRNNFSATHALAQRGLIVVENYDDNSLTVARPWSVKGTEFADYAENAELVCGISNTCFVTNAPIATISPRGRPQRWVVDMSEAAAPGPGPVYYRETFDTLEDATNALLDCYFGDRVDFNNDSLKAWGLSPGGHRSTQNCGEQ